MRSPQRVRLNASSLTTIAGKPAPTGFSDSRDSSDPDDSKTQIADKEKPGLSRAFLRAAG
ncbi:hypothetical protein EMIT0P44_160013 [Pseudomonas sp. IT-P44]